MTTLEDRIKELSSADHDVQIAKNLDEQGHFAEAHEYYSKALASYATLLEVFLKKDKLDAFENSMVEEINAKIVPVSKREQEIESLKGKSEPRESKPKSFENEEDTIFHDKEISDNIKNDDLFAENPENGGWKLVLNIERVVCWQIEPTDNSRKVVADGKYPLKIFEKGNELKFLIFPKVNVIICSTVPCLELTEKHYIFSVEVENKVQIYALVFESLMPDAFVKLFEEIIIPKCIFKKHSKQPQTVKLTNQIVEEPEETVKTVTSTTIEIKNDVAQIVETGIIVPMQEQFDSTVTKENLDRVALNVEIGGRIVTHGILQGGTYLQEGIQYCGNVIKDQVDVGYVEVPDAVRKGFGITKEITPVVSALSGVVVDTIAGVTSKLGAYIGNAAYTTFVPKEEEEDTQPKEPTFFSNIMNDPRTTSTINIGKTGLAALVNVFDALEEAGMGIIGATGNAASNVVEKKFGVEMADVITDGVSITQDLIVTGVNIKKLGPKTLVKMQTKNLVTSGASGVIAGGNSIEKEQLLLKGHPEIEDDDANEELIMFSELEHAHHPQQEILGESQI